MKLLSGLLLIGSLAACRHVDQKELALRLDEIATIGSEAKTPGPRSEKQLARIEAQVQAVTSYVRGLAQ